MKKIVINVENGKKEIIDLTEQEQNQSNIDYKKWSENKAIEDADKQNKKNKKASGKQKLKDLGLDDDEIKALIGA